MLKGPYKLNLVETTRSGTKSMYSIRSAICNFEYSNLVPIKVREANPFKYYSKHGARHGRAGDQTRITSALPTFSHSGWQALKLSDFRSQAALRLKHSGSVTFTMLTLACPHLDVRKLTSAH